MFCVYRPGYTPGKSQPVDWYSAATTSRVMEWQRTERGCEMVRSGFSSLDDAMAWLKAQGLKQQYG